MAAYDDLPDGVVVAGADGLVVEVNPAARRLLADLTDDPVGRPLGEALPLRDDRGRDWWACVDPYGGLAIRTGHPEALLALASTGRRVFVTARYIRAAGPGTPVTRVVVGLRSAAARERAERGSAELVATVAHELRSPLTSVKGWTATLLRKWDRFSDEQRRLVLETVEADADRVVRLIGELLDLARIESGRLEVRPSLVDLAAAVRRQAGALVAAGEPADRFVVAVAGDLPETWADADKVEQVVANLLDNAVRHGAGTVTVRLAPTPSGGTVLEVADQGGGVPEEIGDRVFARFWRGDRRGGTGLGLSVVKGLVEAHGGTVTVGRSADGGAAFTVVLPPGTPLVPPPRT